MTEQQQHLQNLLQQRQSVAKDLQATQDQLTNNRELFLKIQGAIEYLQQIGVTLPEPEETEETAAEFTEEPTAE